MLGYIGGEWFAGDPLDNVAGQPHTVVRIGGHIARRVQAPWQRASEPGAKWFGFPVRREEIFSMLLEPCPMGHKAAKSDRHAAVGRRNVEIQIVVHVTIEIELALLDKLLHHDPSEKLRDRAWAYQRLVRRHRPPALNVGIAIAAGKLSATVLDHHHDCACDL